MTTSQSCVTCGHQNRFGAKFCQKCGAGMNLPSAQAPVPASGARPAEQPPAAPMAVATCVSCKKDIEPGAHFCRHCGALRPPTLTTADKLAAPTPISAPVTGAKGHPPTLPLPVHLSTPPAVMASASSLPSPSLSKGGVGKTLMMGEAALPRPPAAPYQWEPAPPPPFALPRWFWFLFGLLVGVVGTVAIVHSGATISGLFR